MNNYTEQILHRDNPQKETICDGYVEPETSETFYS